LNRTRVELKHFFVGVLQSYRKAFESNQSGIETTIRNDSL